MPLATIAYYGPDDKTPTKVAVGIILRLGDEPVEMKRWLGEDVVHDVRVQREVREFLRQRGVRSVVDTGGVIGCPHEEGVDFPADHECPHCPFWRGMQGIAGTPNLRFLNASIR